MTDVSADFARCAGRWHEQKTWFGTTAIGHIECARCKRRTSPLAPALGELIDPLPVFAGGKCTRRIGP